MGESMMTQSEQSQQIKEITKNLNRTDTIFCMHIDSYLRDFDLLRSEFIEAKWIILTDLYSKLDEYESAWEVYDNPKEYCETIVSKYNRRYLGFFNRIIRRKLPLYTGLIIFILLIVSPNGFSEILYSDNPGIKMPLNSLLGLFLILFLHFVVSFIENKMLFNRKHRNLSFNLNVIVQLFIFLIIVNNKVLIEIFNHITITLNPLIMSVLLGFILIYFIYNHNKLII